jgi:hypothetical protein
MFSAIVRTTVPLVALVLAAGSAATAPQGYSEESAPGITVITTEQAQAGGLQGRPFEMPFADGQNGTELMVRFLREARAAGGSYLADVEIHLVAKKDEAWQDCVTRVGPVDHGHQQVVSKMDYGHYETQSVMRPVTRWVTEYEYRCHMVSRPHMVTSTHYESSYGSHGYSSHPVTQTHTEYRMENECRSEPVSRMVTRYEYQLEQKFVPPEWHTELRWMSDWDLDESPPECGPIEAAAVDAGGPNFVHATLYEAR